MLSYLHVKNLALIDDVEVEFGPGLNILTGETGAGKSVLIGSISLALGKKMSREMIRNENLPALVELVFSVENEKCREALTRMGHPPEEGQVIISRKITGGRSISRMNGEVCTAAQVREAALLLLDLHGQHEHQSLLYREKQLEILDAFGKESLQREKEVVKEAFTVWQKLHRELTESSLRQADSYILGGTLETVLLALSGLFFEMLAAAWSSKDSWHFTPAVHRIKEKRI